MRGWRRGSGRGKRVASSDDPDILTRYRMRRKYRTLLPIALLTVATAAIGIIVYGLLWREARRIQEISDTAAREQAQTVAENIGLLVAEAKSALSDGLARFRGPDFAPQLDAWQRQEPLARFTFVWDRAKPETVVLFPPSEDARPLLSVIDRLWLQSVATQAEAETVQNAAFTTASDQRATLSSSNNYTENATTRQKLRKQSQISSAIAQKAARVAPQAWTNESGFWSRETLAGETLWIGFVAWNAGAVVTGVALDIDALRPSLPAALPSEITSGVSSFSIIDPQGIDVTDLKSKQGASIPSYRNKRYGDSNAGIDLGPELPGWKLISIRDPLDTMANALLSPGGMAAAALLITLYACGLWLAWQSRASQLDAAKKVSFVSNVSHELKTPLTTIRMYSEMLQADRVADEGKRHSYLDTIAKESQRLTRMVNNVLDFSRLERGKATIEPRAQALSTFLLAYLESRRPEIEAQGFVFVTHVEESSRPALFDTDALTQILGNLIDNSLKYARQGAWLSIRSSEEKDSAFIEIRDRGEGLPKRLRRKRFEAFERGDTRLTADVAGFGLGLSIAQTLANEMGAELRYYHPARPSDSPSFVLALQRAD